MSVGIAPTKALAKFSNRLAKQNPHLVVMLIDLRPAGAQPQLPSFSTAHEDKHIGALLADVMNKFGVDSTGSAGPILVAL